MMRHQRVQQFLLRAFLFRQAIPILSDKDRVRSCLDAYTDFANIRKLRFRIATYGRKPGVDLCVRQ